MSEGPELPPDLVTDEDEILRIMIPIDGVRFLGVDRKPRSVRVALETFDEGAACPLCGHACVPDGRPVREHVAALPAFGRTCIFEWHARRWRCSDASCANVFVEADPVVSSRIALLS